MGNKKRKAAGAVILVVMAVCLIPIGQAYYHSAQHRTQQEHLREMAMKKDVEYPAPNAGETNAGETNAGETNVSEENVSTPDGIGISAPENRNKPDVEISGGRTGEKPEISERYAALYEENNDLAGWLSIEGMNINYPVMQCGDDKYYLNHDFYGKKSKYGCLYVKEQADLDSGTNFIIYGHNMKDGSMFGDLDLYLQESFYKEHSTVSFDTLYEERTYEIVAVFLSQVYNVDDDVFKYYQFYEADTQEEFEDFYGNIKELSLYDTGVEAGFGDTFLTLSTCAYHVEDGRLVVVAKRTK